MSSYAGKCMWCGKNVMHKTFFGTLHLCLTDEELAERLQPEQSLQANTPALRELAQKYPKITEAAS